MFDDEWVDPPIYRPRLKDLALEALKTYYAERLQDVTDVAVELALNELRVEALNRSIEMDRRWVESEGAWVLEVEQHLRFREAE